MINNYIDLKENLEKSLYYLNSFKKDMDYIYKKYPNSQLKELHNKLYNYRSLKYDNLNLIELDNKDFLEYSDIENILNNCDYQNLIYCNEFLDLKYYFSSDFKNMDIKINNDNHIIIDFNKNKILNLTENNLKEYLDLFLIENDINLSNNELELLINFDLCIINKVNSLLGLC